MNELVRRAKNLAYRTLTDEIDSYDRTDYNLTSISRFLLLKELMIKKNSIDNEIVFDCSKKNSVSVSHIMEIIDIANYIMKNGLVVLNNTKVRIIPEEISSPELEQCVWVFNKLRDAIAHGDFKPDLSGDVISVDCVSNNPNNRYCLKCDIPMYLIETFTANPDKNIFDIMFEERSVKGKSRHSIYEKSTGDYADLAEETGDYRLTDLYEMLRVLYDEKESLNPDQRKRFYEKVKKFEHFLIDREGSSFFRKKMGYVHKEMEELIQIKSKNYPVDKFASLYGYMIFSMAFNNLDHRNMIPEERRRKYSHLRTSGFTPQYLSIDENGISHKNETSEYDKQLLKIKKRCENFLTNFEPLLEAYKRKPNPRFGANLKQNITSFYDFIMECFAVKNAYLASSVRNCVEHANVGEIRGFITMIDMGNQNDDNSINFYLAATPEDLFDFTSALENDKAYDLFTIGNMFKELNAIVDSEIIKKVYILFQKALRELYGRFIESNETFEHFIDESGTREKKETDEKRIDSGSSRK